MYKENLPREGTERFGNVKIAHFGLFLPLLGTQKNVEAGN